MILWILVIFSRYFILYTYRRGEQGEGRGRTGEREERADKRGERQERRERRRERGEGREKRDIPKP